MYGRVGIGWIVIPAFQISTGGMDSGQPLRGFRNDERRMISNSIFQTTKAVIASEAKQSMLNDKRRWIASSLRASQ
jgi:hypothetical protein